jgi:8-oxo-dGTP pyrophosphatase MutT (NUDIX family)
MTSDPLQFRRQIQTALAGRQRRTLNDPALICAAVLIPLLFKEGEWWVLVTQRTQTVGHHKGQISFPGGACEAEDKSLLATALRETYEEIGVPSDAVEVLGALDDFWTITSFVVTPFVGIIPHPFVYHLNSGEVAAAIEVPLSFLRAPTNLRTEQREHEGKTFNVLFWDYGPYTIWGATARILKDFLDLVSSEHQNLRS